MTLAGVLAALVVLVAFSYVFEALRPVPKRPDRLAWAAGASRGTGWVSSITPKCGG